MLLTRNNSFDPSFNQSTWETLTNGSMVFINSITMKYQSGICVTGFDLVFSDSTITIGDDASHVSLDLTNNKRLYSFASYCGDICDRIDLCSIDPVSLVINCVSGGNVAKTLDNTEYTQNMTLMLVAGDFKGYSGFNCIKNFGIYYILNQMPIFSSTSTTTLTTSSTTSTTSTTATTTTTTSTSTTSTIQIQASCNFKLWCF